MTAANKAVVQAINDALSRNDVAFFLDHCAEDIIWTLTGKPPMKGRQAILDFMNSMGTDQPPMQITLTNLIAEGDHVAADGLMEMAGDHPYKGAFCDIYRFRDGRIAALTSYIVDLKAGDAA